MLTAVPLAAMIAILAATVVRGGTIRRRTGDRPWAFASAKGVQRIAGMTFAISVALLFTASIVSAARNSAEWSVVAAVIALLGAAIVIAAQVQMGRAWRVGVRHGDAPLFVSHGLFRISRNPIFVGMMLVGFAAALSATTWWAWTALAVFIGSCVAQVRIEEKHLDANFGGPYRDFRAVVPRWIGFGGRS